MDWLWTTPSDTITIRDVADAFPEYAYTTLATIMDRLVVKGVLRSERHGRTKRYAATGNSGRHTAVLMYDALSADSNPVSALEHFVESLNDSEASTLRKALGVAGPKRRSPRVQ